MDEVKETINKEDSGFKLKRGLPGVLGKLVAIVDWRVRSSFPRFGVLK